MVCVKLHAHSEPDLLGAIWIVAEDSNVGLRSDLSNLNPHPLDMHLVIKLNAKNELREVTSSQILSLLLRRNLKRVWKLPVRLRAVVECVGSWHGGALTSGLTGAAPLTPDMRTGAHRRVHSRPMVRSSFH